MANIKVVRLTTGEEVIANVVENQSTITLEKPLLLIPMQEGKLTFATWLPYMEGNELEVNRNSVMFSFTPAKQMEDQYASATGQIITPDKKIIM